MSELLKIGGKERSEEKGEKKKESFPNFFFIQTRKEKEKKKVFNEFCIIQNYIINHSK